MLCNYFYKSVHLLKQKNHSMQVHFIAIGGSAMHNLAMALHHKGYNITGSDDEIFEPSKSRLKKYGLLPKKEGWNPNLIHKNLDAVILGMHAREDNPELLKAKELGLKIFSYPEYLYEQSKNKTRVVIGGSHGKTTITSMIIHVLNQTNIKFDYMVGAQLEGFETMVKLSEDSTVTILEGDEYLSSPIDRRPKFHLYFPDIAVISGIAWDHINVFPTFENYCNQFKIFSDLITKNGTLIYCTDDIELNKIGQNTRSDINRIPYSTHPHIIENNKTILKTENSNYPIEVFGEHNLQNLNAAKNVCKSLGLSENDFYNKIKTFKGASKRLQILKETIDSKVLLDFAHSPSKLKATTSAVKTQFPDKKVIACLELHTFSSLNKLFLKEYKGTMSKADIAIVYFNPEVIKHKKLDTLNESDIYDSFEKDNLIVLTKSDDVRKTLFEYKSKNSIFLLMSSGNFDGINLVSFADELI